MPIDASCIADSLFRKLEQGLRFMEKMRRIIVLRLDGVSMGLSNDRI